ncbi:MAG: hypothetical protein ABIH82_05125 [Candidatus Woesearchaeota archaeon]
MSDLIKYCSIGKGAAMGFAVGVGAAGLEAIGIDIPTVKEPLQVILAVAAGVGLSRVETGKTFDYNAANTSAQYAAGIGAGLMFGRATASVARSASYELQTWVSSLTQ